MPIIVCKNCGKITNTAYCFYDHSWIGNRKDFSGCYARINEKDKWEKGCRYENADYFMRNYLKKIIGTSAKFDLKKQLKSLEDILNKEDKNVTRT